MNVFATPWYPPGYDDQEPSSALPSTAQAGCDVASVAQTKPSSSGTRHDPYAYNVLLDEVSSNHNGESLAGAEGAARYRSHATRRVAATSEVSTSPSNSALCGTQTTAGQPYTHSSTVFHTSACELHASAYMPYVAYSVSHNQKGSYEKAAVLRRAQDTALQSSPRPPEPRASRPYTSPQLLMMQQRQGEQSDVLSRGTQNLASVLYDACQVPRVWQVVATEDNGRGARDRCKYDARPSSAAALAEPRRALRGSPSVVADTTTLDKAVLFSAPAATRGGDAAAGQRTSVDARAAGCDAAVRHDVAATRAGVSAASPGVAHEAAQFVNRSYAAAVMSAKRRPPQALAIQRVIAQVEQSRRKTATTTSTGKDVLPPRSNLPPTTSSQPPPSQTPSASEPHTSSGTATCLTLCLPPQSHGTGETGQEESHHSSNSSGGLSGRRGASLPRAPRRVSRQVTPAPRAETRRTLRRTTDPAKGMWVVVKGGKDAGRAGSTRGARGIAIHPNMFDLPTKARKAKPTLPKAQKTHAGHEEQHGQVTKAHAGPSATVTHKKPPTPSSAPGCAAQRRRAKSPGQTEARSAECAAVVGGGAQVARPTGRRSRRGGSVGHDSGASHPSAAAKPHSTSPVSASCAPDAAEVCFEGKSPLFCLMGVPLRRYSSLQELAFGDVVTQPPRVAGAAATTRARSKQAQSVLHLLQRSLALGEGTSAKTLLLERALRQLTSEGIAQNTALACALLLEAADSFTDVERALQCGHQALQLATSLDPAATAIEQDRMALLEMLARLAITRVLSRLIDVHDAEDHLTRAATVALRLGEVPALGYIALQLGITLELQGHFTAALAWYGTSERVADATGQSRLLCDTLLSKTIACYAVGETEMAETAYARCDALLRHFPKAWRQRPLQSLVQVKLQEGDMQGALRLHEEELALAKEQGGDAALVARCLGSIALVMKYLGRYDEAAALYLRELACYHDGGGAGGGAGDVLDARQSVESLAGAAACALLAGHHPRATELATRAVRQAALSDEPCTMAKALIELADVELHDEAVELAGTHLRDAVRAMRRVEPEERKQYLVKATLCELEWRCANCLLSIAVQSVPRSALTAQAQLFEAVLYADWSNVPNTANVRGLLRRRCRLLQPAAADGAGEGDEFVLRDLVTPARLEALLREPFMRHRKLVCYALPWTETSSCMAFVISLATCHDGQGDTRLHIAALPLQLSAEAMTLLVNRSALQDVFDEQLRMPDATGEMRTLYADTPLWPQHFSKVAFECAEQAARLRTDALYCLQLLYDTFIRPLQTELCGTVQGDDAVEGITFIGDGIFSRLPFAAMHDGTHYLAETYSVTTCSSLALTCMLHIAYLARRTRHASDTAAACAPVVARLVHAAAPVGVAGAGESGNVEASEAEPWLAARAVGAGATAVGEGLVTEVTTLQAPCVPAVGEHEDMAAAAARGDGEEAACVAQVRSLLRRLQARQRSTTLSNALYGAVHTPRPTAARRLLLELHLPAVPEVREDYCGYLAAARCDVLVTHAADIANTWNLSCYDLVLCSGCGVYAGLAIHETGVPVYRALQYAAATQLLLPIGSRVPRGRSSILEAVCAAATAGTCVTDALHVAQRRCITAGAPPAVWAWLTLCGLPY